MGIKATSRLKELFIINYSLLILTSCSVTKQISRSAKQSVLKDSSLLTAHTGISIYEPATGKYWYNYNGEKYFVPASNTKIPTCYAAMKYLGDSLVGIKYGIPEEKMYNKSIIFQPTGDPTFMHKDFIVQPVLDFFKKELVENNKQAAIMDTVWKDERWGNGWSWNDYESDYMAERNSFPIFGNVIDIRLNDNYDNKKHPAAQQEYFLKTVPEYFDSLVNEPWIGWGERNFDIKRNILENRFSFSSTKNPFKSQVIPFVTVNNQAIFYALNNAIRKNSFNNIFVCPSGEKTKFFYECPGDFTEMHVNNWVKIHSQPTDSLLKPMMHRSDNFFAEQSLLMVSNERLGIMNDAKIIDTLLKTDLKNLPQKPRWADGSGLSRYNLFTPQDFVVILNKMKNEFGMNRIKEIFPTGGEGTISSYYKADSGYIYAKTGTLSGVVALSGYLTTKRNRELIFSVLVNNHQASATAVRRAVEKFIQGLRDKY